MRRYSQAELQGYLAHKKLPGGSDRLQAGEGKAMHRAVGGGREAQLCRHVIDNLLVRIHFIIVMMRWTGLAPWELELTGCRKVSEKRCIAQSEGAERRSSVGTFGASCWRVVPSGTKLYLRFRGGLVFEAHRLLYHSTLGLRVIKKKKRRSTCSCRVSGFWFRGLV